MLIFRMILIVIIIFLLSFPIFAQGTFFEKGDEGVTTGLIAPVTEGEQKSGGSVGLGVTFLAANEVTGFGLSGMMRGSNSSEGIVSFVMFKGGSIGFSADIFMATIEGGSKYERPGICLTAGWSSLNGIKSYSVGAGFYGDIYASSKIMIQPMAGIAYASSSAGKKKGWGFQFSLMFLNEIASGIKSKLDFGAFVIDIGSDEPVYEATFGVRLGLMFGKASDKK